MDLLPHRPLHSIKPSLASTPLSSHSSNLPFSPGYGNLKASLLIKAVLADRPTSVVAPPDLLTASNYELRPALKHIESLEKQVALSGAKPMSETRLPLKKAAQNEMGMEDTEVESRWVHRLWVGAGSLAMVGMIAKAIEGAGTREESMGVIIAAMGAYIVADLATGIYHWGIDNYGDAKSPIFGSQIDAFQGHHKRPWTITKRQFANNIHALARPATFALAPFLLLPSHAYVDSFLGVFLACVVYSQQFHAWAHTKKKEVPEVVLALQEMGVLVSRKMHGAHHRPPYNVNYCIVSGLWNPLLDRIGFFPTLEKFIFSNFHVRPRSWADTSNDWLQAGSYFSDGTDTDDTSAR